MKTVRKWLILVFGAVILMSVVFTSMSIADDVETKVAAPETKFHRVYILGNGDSDFQDNSFKDDMDELKGDLERSSNQADGSTSKTMIKPTKQEVIDYLNELKEIAQPGEEVTFYFGGHGNVDSIRLRSGVTVTADELAQWLSGFQYSVTLVVILDCCFGGSFVDNIGECNHVTVIGPKGKSPIDPWGIFGGLVETFTEEIADQAGEREADKNGDGNVTGDELKECLEGKNWELGESDENTVIRNGQSRCLDCILPSIYISTYDIVSSDIIDIYGDFFEPNSIVNLSVYDSDLIFTDLDQVICDEYGSFYVSILEPSVPSMIVATDEYTNWDWYIYDNYEPSAPIITSENTGTVGADIAFSFVSTDPNNHSISYTIDWGDESSENISSFLSNNTAYIISHNWTDAGVYTISAYGLDEYYLLSEKSYFTLLIDTEYVGDLGYIKDSQQTGIYDIFYSNSTGVETTPEYQGEGIYLIDINDDGISDYDYNTISKVLTSVGGEKAKDTPGFELLIMIFALFIILVYKRKKQI